MLGVKSSVGQSSVDLSADSIILLSLCPIHPTASQSVNCQSYYMQSDSQSVCLPISHWSVICKSISYSVSQSIDMYFLSLFNLFAFVDQFMTGNIFFLQITMWKSLSKRTIHHHSIFSYEIQLLLSLELLPPHSSISCHKLKREDLVLQHINISNGKIRKQGDKNNERKLSYRRLHMS